MINNTQMLQAESGNFRRSVFISHASKDFRIANEIRELLEAIGVRCWIAPRDIPPGYQYGTAIIDAIRECTITLLVLTEDSNKSKPVENEIERAFSYQKTIVPVRLREIKPSNQLEFFVSNAQWVDAFMSPLKQRVEQIANIVQAIEFNRPAPVPLPEQRTISGTLELYFERAFRHKVLSIFAGFTILLIVSVGIFLLQFSSRAELSGATIDISRSADKIGIAANTIEQTSSTIKNLDAKVDQVKKETSSDPRKELANRGIQWTKESLRDALDANDLETVSLFMDGKYNFHQSNLPLAISFYFKKDVFSSKIKVLELMRRKGFDFLVEFQDPARIQNVGHYSPLTAAADKRTPSLEAVRWLLANNDKSVLRTYKYILEDTLMPSDDCAGNEDFFDIYTLLTDAGLPKDTAIADGYRIAFQAAFKIEHFDIPNYPNNQQLADQLKQCERYIGFLRPNDIALQKSAEHKAKELVSGPMIDELNGSIKMRQAEIADFLGRGVKDKQMVRVFRKDKQSSRDQVLDVSFQELRDLNNKEILQFRKELKRIASL